MRTTLLLLVTAAFLGSLQAQYPTLGCTRQVTLPSSTYTVPTYTPQCQYYQPSPPPRVSLVPYQQYCQPQILQQNIVPPPTPVYQAAPIIVPIPAPPKNCETAHTTVQQQTSEHGPQHGYSPGYSPGHSPGHPPHPYPDPTPHPGFASIPGLSNAEANRLVPNLGNYGGHNHPVVVQSVIVGKKEKNSEEEKREKEKEKDKDRDRDKEKGEPCKKKPKKKCSEELDDDEHEERSYRRKRKRRVRKQRRRYYYDPSDPYDMWDPPYDPYDPCAECNIGGSPPSIVYYN